MGDHSKRPHGAPQEPVYRLHTGQQPLMPPPPLPQAMTSAHRAPKATSHGKTAAIVALSLYSSVMTFAVIGRPDVPTSAVMSVSESPTASATTRKPSSPSPSPTPVRRLTKKDLRLDVIETRRKCFGSAGCNVNYEVEVRLVTDALPSDDSYQVRYRVTAAGREVVTNSFELHGTKYSIAEDFSMDIPEGVKLRAAVLSVKRLP
jgi:hypothetical protein